MYHYAHALAIKVPAWCLPHHLSHVESLCQHYIYSLLVGSRLPTCRLFSGLLRDWQDEDMCKRHDVGRMKDRESQKPDEGIGIGICYWNRKRWICRRLQYQVRKESEGYTELITLTDSHLHGIRSGQKGGDTSQRLLRHSWLAYI